MKLEKIFHQSNKSKNVGNLYSRIQEIFLFQKNFHMDSQLPSLHLSFALSQNICNKATQRCISMISSYLGVQMFWDSSPKNLAIFCNRKNCQTNIQNMTAIPFLTVRLSNSLKPSGPTDHFKFLRRTISQSTVLLARAFSYLQK